MKDESSLARNRAAAAISSGRPSRPIGWRGASAASVASGGGAVAAQQARRDHRPGRERVDPDALLRVVERQHLGELDQRGLRCARDGPAGLRGDAELRGDVDDRPAAPGDQMRDRRLARGEGAGHVGADRTVPERAVELGDRQGGCGVRDPVHEHVESLEAVETGLHRPPHVGRTGHVAPDRYERPVRGDGVRMGITIGGDHPRALGREPAHDRQPDARRPGRHQADAPVQTSHHILRRSAGPSCRRAGRPIRSGRPACARSVDRIV